MKSILEQNGGTYAVTILARKLETIRANMIGSFYALRHNGKRRSEAQKYLDQAIPLYDRYIALCEAIKTHKTDLNLLQKEKDALPVVSIRKRRDLTRQMEEKEAEIAKLQKRKKAVMQKYGKTDHAGMQEIQQQIAFDLSRRRHDFRSCCLCCFQQFVDRDKAYKVIFDADFLVALAVNFLSFANVDSVDQLAGRIIYR